MMFFGRNQDSDNILEIRKSDAYHSVDDLIARSRPSSVYYTMLFFSSLIIASGLIMNNSPIVIGGMLLTPVLTPIMLFSLGLSIFEIKAIFRGGLLMIVSFLIVIGLSYVVGLFFGTNSATPSNFVNLLYGSFYYLYFLVAFIAGMAATLAWSRKNQSDVLPGVAIAVSLVPPLSLFGLSLSGSEGFFAQAYLSAFILNFAGLVLGSFIIYLLLRFYRVKKEVEKDFKAE